jgi:lipopolysaccharide biosynthesis glycosyltransferase
MIKVFIGTEASQYIPQKVLEYSIQAHTDQQVECQPIKQTIKRVGGTNFGFVRFQIPSLCNFTGRAIYLDADQLVISDIADLYNVLEHSDHSIALVDSPKGYFGKRRVPKHLHTSVMVLDCSKLQHWDGDTMFHNVVPNKSKKRAGQIHYRDFMNLVWEDRDSIKALDPGWNHFNIINPDTKLVHFSHVNSQPWKRPGHKLSRTWGSWLRKAIRAGFVSRTSLVSEILKRHIHPYYLFYAVF